MEPSDLEEGLEKLRQDLGSGKWDAQYGTLRTQDSYEVGYQFIVAEAHE